MKNITISIVILEKEMDNDIISCLDSLINQTLTNTEIIIINENLQIPNNEKYSNVYVVNKLKDINLRGKYTIIVNPNYQYLLVGLESLYNYSKLYDLDLLLFTPLKYDINSKEIYETKLNNEHVLNSDKEIFDNIFLKDSLFSMQPTIFNMFYKTDFLKKKLSFRNLENKKDEKLLFYESLINAQKIGFFRNNIYIKKDDLKTMNKKIDNENPMQKFSQINNNQNIKEIFYEFRQLKFPDIIELTNDLLNMLEENKLYHIYKYHLYNFKIELLKEFFFNMSLQSKCINYNLLKSDFDILYSNKVIHDYIVTNLNRSNLKFYRNIITSKSLKELILLYEPEINIDNWEIDLTIKDENHLENLSLKLKNQQLLLENKTLKTNNDKLNSQISKLKSENQKLKEINQKNEIQISQNNSLKTNNDKLNSQISKLKSENQKLKEINQKSYIQISRLEDMNKILNKTKPEKKKNTGMLKRFLNGK